MANNSIRSTASWNNSISIPSMSPYSPLSPSSTSGIPTDWPGNGRDNERGCFAPSTPGASRPQSNFPLPYRCSKNLGLMPERFSVLSPSPLKVSMKRTSIGCFQPFPMDQTRFDTFYVLSLIYRGNGFITMLAPFRDYLRPKDPTSSLLLGATKELYFSRLSVEVYPEKSDFKESQWITSEDANVERLLDVFTSIDTDSKTPGTSTPDSWNTSIGINHGLSRWGQRSRHSQTTIPPKHNAWVISCGYFTRLGIGRNTNGSLPTP